MTGSASKRFSPPSKPLMVRDGLLALVTLGLIATGVGVRVFQQVA